MTIFLLIVIFLSIGLAGILYHLKRKLELKLAKTIHLWTSKVEAKEAEFRAIQEYYSKEAVSMQAAFDKKISETEAYADDVRAHYEAESLKAQQEAQQRLANALAQLESLKGYASAAGEEAEIAKQLALAIEESGALREEAALYLEQAKLASISERSVAQKRAREIQAQAEALLEQATRDAGRIYAEAEQRAIEIGGEAYQSLKEKELLERAVTAIQNVIDGYGDKYVIPTHSLLDELADEFGHTAAGESLKGAREQSRRMAEQGEAATCAYVEANRRETAIRFVVDAFNGRVDAILSRVKHDNYGTLEQEIRDAFALVNLHGHAFRDARILPAYLNARVAELRWAVVAHELKRKEREEQRRLQEQIREEEKARRDYERAIQEAAREEEAIRRAMVKARAEVESASAEERAKLEAEMAELTLRLSEAESKNQRAISMAQQTRSGNVYIISNLGSFGEHVFKIGMTRRLEPLDRIKELGDASVPFEFDIHAMIRSDDAPGLERLLHNEFDDLRINKVNYRKEFFRIPLERIREVVEMKNLQVTFTMAAEAKEYRETMALQKMTPEERARYNIPQNEKDKASEDE